MWMWMWNSLRRKTEFNLKFEVVNVSLDFGITVATPLLVQDKWIVKVLFVPMGEGREM